MDDAELTAAIERDAADSLDAGEPTWSPLERLLPGNDAAAFEYAGRADAIHVYRHGPTGRFLNLDDRGRPHRFDPLTGGYRPTSRRQALRHLLGDAPDPDSP